MASRKPALGSKALKCQSNCFVTPHHDAGESLLNWQGHIDSVCGIKTVRSMDAWFRKRFPFAP